MLAEVLAEAGLVARSAGASPTDRANEAVAMSTLHVRIDEAARLAELVDRLGPCDEISLERGERTVARVVPARAQPYVGLYGNHPYELRRRPVPHPPELAPDDFMD